MLENSLNDFKKELNKPDKKAFILVGPPRSGKTSLIHKYLQPRIRNLKIIDSDDISLKFTKDPNLYKSGSYDIAKNYAEAFLSKIEKDVHSFVFDSTGRNISRLERIANLSRNAKFKVIVLHVISNLEDALERNEKTDRKVNPLYLINIHEISKKAYKEIYNRIMPDKYFVVYNSNEKQVWYEYDGVKIKR